MQPDFIAPGIRPLHRKDGGFMGEPLHFHFNVDGENFTSAGEASVQVKKHLRQLGMPAETIRCVSIAMYEGEINRSGNSGCEPCHAGGIFHRTGNHSLSGVWCRNGLAEHEAVHR